MRGETLGQRTREAGDHARIPRELGVGIVAGVAARKCDDAQHLGMLHEGGVEAVHARKRQLEHHLLIVGERLEMPLERCLEEDLGLLLLGTVDVDFGLDDRQ